MNAQTPDDKVNQLTAQAGLLLLVNFAALGCGAAALVCGLFKANFVIAAFPAFLALLLSFWQPWGLLLCLLPHGMAALAPFVSVPITLLVYRTLHKHNKRSHGCQKLRRRYSPRTVGAALGGLVILGTLVSFAGYKDIPPQNRAIPPSLERLNKNFAKRYAFTDSRYYTLSSFLSQDFLWRVQVPKTQMPHLAETLGLSRVPARPLPDHFWNQPPFWWQRPEGHDTEKYTGGDFSVDGGESDGWHAGAVYDTQTETLFLWGKDNY